MAPNSIPSSAAGPAIVAANRLPVTSRISAALRSVDLLRFGTLLRGTFASVLEHDCLNIAQAAAYSALVSLFPALIVVAAIVPLLPDTAPIRFQSALFFDRVLPGDVSPILDSYFQNSQATVHSTRALVLAALVSLTGASSVIVTLMEGFRRAFSLPPNLWNLWGRRWRSVALVFIALVPLMIASVLVIFGSLASSWIAANIGASARLLTLALAFIVRWTVALISSVFVIAVIYHMGIPPAGLALSEEPLAADHLWGSVRTVHAMSTMQRSWTRTLPGATLATFMWFFTTLLFGWYVTRFANYSEVYGSLGAGVALLFWLYIISLSVLAGAEFNAQLYPAYCGVTGNDIPDPSSPVIAQTELPG